MHYATLEKTTKWLRNIEKSMKNFKSQTNRIFLTRKIVPLYIDIACAIM